MKKLLSIIVLCIVIDSFAQVGINTIAPRASLDVQGGATIRGNIRTSGTDTNKGQTGRMANLLVSRGVGNSPEWRALRLPIVKSGRYYLLFANSYSDRVGIRPTTLTGTTPVNYDMALPTTGWSTISNLTQTFSVINPVNRAFVLFEAVAQINSSAQYHGVDFTCGVFIDDKLIGARTVDLYQATTGGNSVFRTFTILATTDQPLSVSNSHVVKIACTRRSNYGGFTGNLGIGVPESATSANINDFMSQSSLRVEVFETPVNTLNVVN